MFKEILNAIYQGNDCRNSDYEGGRQCLLVNTNGELIFGSDPEFETVKEALAFSLSQPQVGLCGESS